MPTITQVFVAKRLSLVAFSQNSQQAGDSSHAPNPFDLPGKRTTNPTVPEPRPAVPILTSTLFAHRSKRPSNAGPLEPPPQAPV
ncbi:hypothetical protein T492DRAFT_896918 [Pavlovales sp. CCMP2436]|nr:hypothetical protein T492DRAFT_896918 [Pavlovales sp. CCMP2436]